MEPSVPRVQQAEDGVDGQDGAIGPTGSDGIACWDLNGNGIGDPSEDINGDNNIDVLDCQGTSSDDQNLSIANDSLLIVKTEMESV